MRIRTEQEQDCDVISKVTAQAFAAVKHSNKIESAIVVALRDAKALSLSLVAESRNEVIGHIALSPVTIGGAAIRWFALGPLSVRPDRQGIGVGGALIRQGLDHLRALGAAGCVLLGDPAYYRRFGFENDSALHYKDAPSKYFMMISFGGSVPVGRVEYHHSFGSHLNGK